LPASERHPNPAIEENDMGIDVVAYYPDSVSTKEEIDAAFAEAEAWLLKNAGGCDGFIRLGSLDCSQSIGFLERAIRRTFEPSKGEIWAAKEVRQLSESANWPDLATVPDDERWAYWSARKFLEICVEHHLGIWTS
jgi:hypothetical protein